MTFWLSFSFTLIPSLSLFHTLFFSFSSLWLFFIFFYINTFSLTLSYTLFLFLLFMTFWLSFSFTLIPSLSLFHTLFFSFSSLWLFGFHFLLHYLLSHSFIHSFSLSPLYDFLAFIFFYINTFSLTLLSLCCTLTSLAFYRCCNLSFYHSLSFSLSLCPSFEHLRNYSWFLFILTVSLSHSFFLSHSFSLFLSLCLSSPFLPSLNHFFIFLFYCANIFLFRKMVFPSFLILKHNRHPHHQISWFSEQVECSHNS